MYGEITTFYLIKAEVAKNLQLQLFADL